VSWPGGAEDIGAHGEMGEIGADAWQRSDGAGEDRRKGGAGGDRDAADLYRAPIVAFAWVRGR
jgi:hypothetical protein